MQLLVRKKMVLIHPRVLPDPSSPEGGCLEVSFPEDSGCETFYTPLNPKEEVIRRLGRRVIPLVVAPFADHVPFARVEVKLWSHKAIDGNICQSIEGRSPSTILSEYFGYPVHLVIKGPRARMCRPTPRFPDLEAPSQFQDGYPVLVVSEESVAAVQDQVRDMVGVQGVGEKWAWQALPIER